ncbi:MAG: DUF4097 family beta strand repeat-containing protein [Gammaproteobacteria bacterium]
MQIKILNICALFITFLMFSVHVRAETREFEVGNNPELRLENIAGEISVSAGDTDQIVIEYEIEGEDVDVIFEQSGNAVAVKVVHPKKSGWFGSGNNHRVDFVIEMPATGRYALKSVSGDIDVAGVGGRVRLETVSGSIRILESSGHLELRTVSGSIEMEKVQSADLEVNTVSGDIDYKDGDLSGENYDFSSVSGDISISFDNEASFRVRGKTVSGGVRIDSGVKTEIFKHKYAGNQSFDGEYNGGETGLNLSSVSGSIRLDAN